MLWEMGLSREAGAGPQENGYVIRVYLYGGRASTIAHESLREMPPDDSQIIIKKAIRIRVTRHKIICKASKNIALFYLNHPNLQFLFSSQTSSCLASCFGF
jgi:hypothetical protein